MNREQHTIKEIGTVKGTGLHTGKEVTIFFLPAPPDHGIKFQRIDLPSQPIIDAIADYAVETQYQTKLDNGTVSVSTIEHILAAVSGLEIDNILIQLDGSEVPILDGSAAPFVKILQQIGLENQYLPRKFFHIDDLITQEDPTLKSFYKILPAPEYELMVKIADTTPIFPSQSAYMINLKEFTEKIASARTFIFINEIANLYDQGFIQGGTVGNGLVFAEEGYDTALINQLEKKLNQSLQDAIICQNKDPKLRYPNEPARHKLLDLLGDLTLVGSAMKGQIIAENPGHVANVAFAKKLRKIMLKQPSQAIASYHVHEKPILDIQQLSKLLPHRYPFQLVDKIVHLGHKSVTGIKNVTINEPYFQGHFPGTPVMPGVLQIETLIQTAGTLILNKVEDPEHYLTYFLGIDKCKFRKMVVPGDTLILDCYLLTDIKHSETTAQIRKLAKIQGKAFVGKQLACEAILFAQIVKKIG